MKKFIGTRERIKKIYIKIASSSIFEDKEFDKESEQKLYSLNSPNPKRLAIYNAIIGKYDDLLMPNFVNEYCDYYCVTDNKDIHSDFWNIIYIDKSKFGIEDLDNIKLARFVKTHPHLLFGNYEHTLWIDSNMIIEKSVATWIMRYLKQGDSLLVHSHNDRKTLNEEALEIIKANKDTSDNVYSQLNKYKIDGYDLESKNLVMTNVLYRKNNENCNTFNEMWWNEIKNGSRRDQLSFNYAAWRSNLKYSVCNLDPFGNIFFTRVKHSYTNK